MARQRCTRVCHAKFTRSTIRRAVWVHVCLLLCGLLSLCRKWWCMNETLCDMSRIHVGWSPMSLAFIFWGHHLQVRRVPLHFLIEIPLLIALYLFMVAICIWRCGGINILSCVGAWQEVIRRSQELVRADNRFVRTGRVHQHITVNYQSEYIYLFRLV